MVLREPGPIKRKKEEEEEDVTIQHESKMKRNIPSFKIAFVYERIRNDFPKITTIWRQN